jgi:uncharacterized linocin/CFP29 family protein
MTENIGVDIVHNSTGSGIMASGTVAQRLISSGMDAGVLKPWIGSDGKVYMNRMINGEFKAVELHNANATLRKDEWKAMDEAVLFASQERLVGVADLYARNLVFRTNGMASTVLEYEDYSAFTDADVSMDAVTPGHKDRPESSLNYLPLPIIHKDFSINARALAASRTGSTPLDTTSAMLAARQVSEMAEYLLFTGGSNLTFGGGTIYGYLDYPSINSVTLSQNWDASGKTGDEIIEDVLEMKQKSINAKHYGPWILYIPTAYETAIDADFKAASDKTIRQRILEISGIQDVKVADKLTANKCVLVQMTSDVVRMVEGMPIQTVQWDERGGFTQEFKVLTIMVPQIRADQDGNCGVTVLSA